MSWYIKCNDNSLFFLLRNCIIYEIHLGSIRRRMKREGRVETTLGRCEKSPFDMFPRLFKGVNQSIKKLSADKKLKDRDNTFFGQVMLVVNNNNMRRMR